MAIFKKSIIILFFLTLIPSALFARDLTIGVGLFEPFFVKKDESGVFLDLIKETFKFMPQHKIKFLFMSNQRLLRDLNMGNIDAAANIFKDSGVNAYLSEPVFRYTDVAVTRKDRNFSIDEIADLQDKTIAAYENATTLLGGQFEKMATSNPGYEEFPEPFVTTNLLIKGRKDVRIGDIFIFLYDINRPLNKNRVKFGDFTVHPLFPDVYSHVGFKDKKICGEFDHALEKIKADGTFEAVYQKYELYLK